MLWESWTIPPLVFSLVLLFAVAVICVFDSNWRLAWLTALIAFLAFLSASAETIVPTVNSFWSLVTTLAYDFQLKALALSHANMIVSGAALIWLLRRALQTLWTPVPELISILGVEVPVPPDVSLAAISADKATITWSRPPVNRPVEKYIIQVNGVNVGESTTSNETFITVSGLKSNHFYNVRIIAVGSNNFQAGSRVLRLRTFGPDGRPCLGTQRLPSDFTDDDNAQRRPGTPGGEENGSARQFVTSTFGIAQPTGPDGSPSLTWEGGSGSAMASVRRNTVNRRHSPSMTSLDQQQQMQQAPPTPKSGGVDEDAEVSDAQMAELNQRYLSLRKETEEALALIAKEEEEMKKVVKGLEEEKRVKRTEHRQKEEQTEKLKREQGLTERAMRAALQIRAQKERKLKERNQELKRIHDTIAKKEKSIQEMQEQRQEYNKKRAELEEEQQKKTTELQEETAKAQAECSRLENQLKERRQQVKELEDSRKTLVSNGDDSEWRKSIIELRKSNQREELQYRNAIIHENRRQQGLDSHHQIVLAQLQQIPAQSGFGSAVYGAFNPANAANRVVNMAPNMASNMGPHLTQPMSGMPGLSGLSSTAPPPGFDYEPLSGMQTQQQQQQQPKRRSRPSNSLSGGANGSAPSPGSGYSLLDLSGSSSAVATPPSFINIPRPPTQSSFLTGPFMGPSADHPDPDDPAVRALTNGAPMSPHVISLLPSNIFADDEPAGSPMEFRGPSPFVPHGAELSPFAMVGTTMDGAANDGTYDEANDNTNVSNNGSNGSNGSSHGKRNSCHDRSSTGGVSATAHTSAASAGAIGPHSPASSSRSMSVLSSPRDSSQSLSFPPHTTDSADGGGGGVRAPQASGLPSPIEESALEQSTSNITKFGGIFSFPRSRGATASKAMEEIGPALGTLKHGQSQSFPRQTDDLELGNKNRRISLSSWSVFNRSSATGAGLADHGQLPSSTTPASAAAAAASSPLSGLNKGGGVFSAKSLFPFGSRTGGALSGAFGGRDTNSPRPASMASLDMPRPSTDSGSIWGPPLEGAAPTAASVLSKTNLLWPSDNAWPSRTPSRRPSVHGSLSALETNLASADDEILDEKELLNPETSPSQVGVIGSRPPTAAAKASNLGKALNPAAPTFMANIFRPKTDKDKDREKDKDKPKAKEKEKDKPKGKDKDKDKAGKDKTKLRDKNKGKDKDRAVEAAGSPDQDAPSGGHQLQPLPSVVVMDEAATSQLNIRRSRDGGLSVRTQTSVSESLRESLRESLDYTVSHTTSEPNSVSVLSSSKDSGGGGGGGGGGSSIGSISGDNALMKLFRKESTPKLNFTRRIGRASKGSGASVTNSETNRSSFGDLEEGLAASLSMSVSSSPSTMGFFMTPTEESRSTDSVGVAAASSLPVVGPSKSREKGESKLKGSGSWFSIKKKSREKESLEMDRDKVAQEMMTSSASAPAMGAAAASESAVSTPVQETMLGSPKLSMDKGSTLES